MSSSRLPPSSKLLDLDITIISAKHLKNVNWRHGDLKPYVAFYLEPGRRFTTKPDDSLSTRPVWNERFILPINFPLQEALLTIEINHFENPNPLVGSVEFPLKHLINSDDSNPVRTLELRRPSGRPQGKIRLKLTLRERERPAPAQPLPDYQFAPSPNYYYSSAPPPPRDYRNYSTPPPYNPSHIPQAAPALPPPPSPYQYGSYSEPYPPYYSGYYSHPPPPSNRQFLEQSPSYSGHSGPSAPVDYSSYDHKAKGMGGTKMGLGTGLAVGAVAGALGGLALEEGIKYEEDKIADRVENDLAARDDYSDYRANY